MTLCASHAVNEIQFNTMKFFLFLKPSQILWLLVAFTAVFTLANCAKEEPLLPATQSELILGTWMSDSCIIRIKAAQQRQANVFKTNWNYI